MNRKFKKALKVFLLVLLIALAGLGIGLTGGIPISNNTSRKDPMEVKTESEEIEEEDTDKL